MSLAHSDAQPNDPVFMCSLSGVNVEGSQFVGDVTTAPTSGAWAAANRAYFVPFRLDKPFLLNRWWWLNGATVGTNNLQAGIYDQSFAKFAASASTLSAGTVNQVQYVTEATPIWIPAMRGYLALWCNGTTATVFRKSAWTEVGGVYLQDSLTTGLPATATPATAGGLPVVPVFGFTRRASP